MNGQSKKRPQEPQRIAIKQRTISVRFQRPELRAQTRRLGDFVAACALIAFTLPLMAIVAIAIKFESPGPVFERQQCVGIGGRRFDALKFRTTLHAVEDPGLTWRRAPEMTRLGPYLRYTGIDDLPQLFNVLRGEMSIIDSGAGSPSFLD
jgi:undecaprenyl-phosphate galactose phosphotransferase/putative colanic acid biosynthesis UDP-glucose lipid carrier transferase